MKKIITILLLIVIYKMTIAQNVGIGTTEPVNKLHIVGSLLVNTPIAATSTPPTVAQIKTLPGLGTISFLNTDSTGRLYDSGGPTRNYGIDHDSKANIPFSSNIAFEVTLETMDLNTGDSLIIKESSTGATLLAVGNVHNSTGKWVFNSSSLYINFKSNADFNTGAGFSLLFRRLYNYGLSLPDISGIAGTALFFDAKTGAFRSGRINNNVKGQYSTAMGIDATASGFASLAMGAGATAGGNTSTAMGLSVTASGFASIAMGNNTSAAGDYSTATGANTIADGDYSTAMGRLTGARGAYSTAMGYNTSANNAYSTAMGRQTVASGENSTAMGKYTDATGYAATAIGDSSLASGAISFASGFRTNASGYSSTAMGYEVTASGDFSTAMGYEVTANSNFSTAIGNYVSTNNKIGSFMLGDNSSAAVMMSPAFNSFSARFAGGYRLFTNPNLTAGCFLNESANAWSTPSDVHTKENFAAVNGEDFLKKISGFHLTSWNYKTQNPATFRHYGPMAQDFYAAFGKDQYGTIGNDTTINSADFAGVSFIAIQALEKRTQKIEHIEKANNDLKKENAELKEMILLLRKEMDELKNKPKQINLL